MKLKIQELKKTHRLEMFLYDENRRKHIADGYKQDCDYYNHQTNMSNYHRGAYNALNDLEKTI